MANSKDIPSLPNYQWYCRCKPPRSLAWNTLSWVTCGCFVFEVANNLATLQLWQAVSDESISAWPGWPSLLVAQQVFKILRWCSFVHEVRNYDIGSSNDSLEMSSIKPVGQNSLKAPQKSELVMNIVYVYAFFKKNYTGQGEVKEDNNKGNRGNMTDRRSGTVCSLLSWSSRSSRGPQVGAGSGTVTVPVQIRLRWSKMRQDPPSRQKRSYTTQGMIESTATQNGPTTWWTDQQLTDVDNV